jgi:hypothetical protein
MVGLRAVMAELGIWVHEQQNGHLGSIYKDVTNFTQIKDREGPTNWNSACPRAPSWILLLILTSFSPSYSRPNLTPHRPTTTRRGYTAALPPSVRNPYIKDRRIFYNASRCQMCGVHSAI